MSQTPVAPGVPDPRPPSPANSVASFASSTTSFRRRARDRHEKPEVKKKKAVVESRFDKEDATVDDAMAFLSRPHSSWDSASRELARLESARQRLDDDARSSTSSISAYSVVSTTSTRKGGLAMLPKSPPPAPNLSVGGTGVGGFSFVAPRLGSSVSSVSAASERVGSVAGSASGRSGVRAMSTKHTPTPQRDAQPQHPSSAPNKHRGDSQRPSDGAAPSFQLNGQFVPRLAPKRTK